MSRKPTVVTDGPHRSRFMNVRRGSTPAGGASRRPPRARPRAAGLLLSFVGLFAGAAQAQAQIYLSIPWVGPATGIVRGAQVDVNWEVGSAIPTNSNVVIEYRQRYFWDFAEPFLPWEEVARGNNFQPCTIGSDSCVSFEFDDLFRGAPFTLEMRTRQGGSVLESSPQFKGAAPNNNNTDLRSHLTGAIDIDNEWQAVDVPAGPFLLELAFSEPYSAGYLGVLSTEVVQGLAASDFVVVNGTLSVEGAWGGGTYKIKVVPTNLGDPVSVSLPASSVLGVGEGVTSTGLNNFTRPNLASNEVVIPTAGPSGMAMAADPLTAEFRNLPSSHDGANPFQFRLKFSDDVTISVRNMRDSALVVAGGAVSKARRVSGRRDLWKITIAPSGDGAVSILVPIDRACIEAGALCASDGRMLSAAPGAMVAGPPQQPQEQSRSAPLTASFDSVPSEHDGAGAFNLELSFSEPISSNFRVLRDQALSAAGGSVKRARRVDGRSDRWEIRVKPSGNGPVTVSLASPSDCSAAGAICAEDGRALSNAASVRIEGPPGLSVEDAEVQEGPGAVLAFPVKLARAASAAVSVEYRTSDGSAMAGADYNSANGTLVFSPGEIEKAVQVQVLDDAHDEGRETMELLLSAASGAHVVDGSGRGTIVNSDPLPRALLARFGRTTAVQIVAHVEERLEAAREPGFRARVAGHDVRPGMERDLALGVLNRLGARDGAHPPGGRGNDPTSFGPNGGGAFDMPGFGDQGGQMAQRTQPDAGGLFRTALGGGNLTTGSALTVNRRAGRDGVFSFWSRAAQSNFAGQEGALSLSGQVRTSVVGADYAKGPLTTGLSLLHSAGRGSYSGVDGGEAVSSVTGLYPWLGYQATDRITVWGVTGYGKGTLNLAPGKGAPLKTGLSMAMAAAGLQGDLAASFMGGFGLAFKADTMWVQTDAAGVRSPTGSLAATKVTVARFRTALEAARRYQLGSGLSVKPSLEVGLRRDTGDAEEGAGVDIAGGLVLTHPTRGLSADIRIRRLIAHQTEGFRDQGVSLSFSFDPKPMTPLGFSAQVAPSWGAQAMSGAEALWNRETMAGLAPTSSAPGSRVLADVGYGMAVGSRLVGTPKLAIATSELSRDYRLGYRLSVLPDAPLFFELGVNAQRREGRGLAGPDHGVVGQLTARW